MGGARRDCRRNSAQPHALRLPDPRAEGAAPVARGRSDARDARRTRSLTPRARSSARAPSAPRCSRSAPRGAEAGWAFQLQDPRTIMLLLLLAVAITPTCSACSNCRCSAAAQPAGSFGTGALARVRRDALRRAVPWRRARDRAAAAAGRIGRGLRRARAWPRATVPGRRLHSGAANAGCRSRAPGWRRLQRFLAIPMAASAVGCLWLLYRLGGRARAVVGGLRGRNAARSARRLRLSAAAGARSAWLAALAGARRLSLLRLSQSCRSAPPGASSLSGAEPWSEARVANYRCSKANPCSSISPPTGA